MRALLDVNVLRFVGCGAFASWFGGVLAGKRDSAWLGIMPAHPKRLHTHHVATQVPGQFASDAGG
jgi:hypothetical protein